LHKRLAITGNHQIYLPTEIEKMLEDAGRIRKKLLFSYWLQTAYQHGFV